MGKKKDVKQKTKNYICYVCGKKKRSDKKVNCCGKEMLTPEKGAWDF